MARRDIVAALGLLIVGICYAFMTANLSDRNLPNTPGPAFFPWLITIGLLILAAALLIRGLTVLGRRTSPAVPRTHPILGLITLISFVAYLVLMPVLGFLVASVPFFAALMILFGGRSRLNVALAAIAVPTAIYLLFLHGFQIHLPNGFW